MNRKLTLLAIMMIAASMLFAAGNGSSATLSKAYLQEDKTSSYQATKRDIEYIETYSDGAVRSEGSISVSYTTKYGYDYYRSVEGNSEVLAVLDRLSTITVLTPFSDSIIKSSPEYLRTEILDGKEAQVFEIDIALNTSSLAYGDDSRGEIIGLGSDRETDGSAKVYVWLEKNTGAILRMERFFDALDAHQTVYYSPVDGLMLPARIETEITETRTINTKIAEKTTIKATETLSGYWDNPHAN